MSDQNIGPGRLLRPLTMVSTMIVLSFVTWYITDTLVNKKQSNTQSSIEIFPSKFRVTSSDSNSHSVNKKFTIKNMSKKDIVIESVLPTCSCTVLKEYNHVRLGPQAALDVEFVIEVPQIGSKRSFIMVKHNKSQTPAEVVIEAVGKTGLPVVLSKKGQDVVFLELKDLTESRQIVVTTREELGSKAWLEKFVSQIEAADLSWKITEKQRTDSIERRYEISIRWNQRPKSSEFLGKVFAVTADESSPIQIGSISGTLAD